jgi:hypothetical protein
MRAAIMQHASRQITKHFHPMATHTPAISITRTIEIAWKEHPVALIRGDC